MKRTLALIQRYGVHRSPCETFGRMSIGRSLLTWLVVTGLFLGASNPASAQKEMLRQPLTVRWQNQELAASLIVGASDSDRVYVIESGGAVVAIAVADGKLLWRSDLGGEIVPTPFASPAEVFVASESVSAKPNGSRSGQVRQLTAQSGLTLWASLLSAPWIGSLAASDTALFGCGRDGRISAIAKRDGRLLWTSDRSVQCTVSPILSNERLLTADARGDIISLDHETGNVLWRKRLPGGRVMALGSGGEGIFVGTADGRFYALGQAGQTRWSTRAGNGTQSMILTEGGLLVTSLDNFVYALSPKTGKRRWKYRLDGRPAAAPLIEGESVFLLDSSGIEGVVLDLKTGKPVNRVALGPQFEPTGSAILMPERLILLTRQGLVGFAPNPGQ